MHIYIYIYIYEFIIYNVFNFSDKITNVESNITDNTKENEVITVKLVISI